MYNESLIEFLEFFKIKFPKIDEKKLIKIIFSVKSRNKKYGIIGLSRLESTNYGLSEYTMNRIINFFVENGILEKKGKKLRKQKDYYCNIYIISNQFIQLFNNLEFFEQKIFEYIDPIIWMNRFCNFCEKKGKFLFKIYEKNYIIQKKGKFKGKIYSCDDNIIVNPLTLIT